MRTFFRFRYEQNKVKDSPYYSTCAQIINRNLMRKLDNESIQKANDSWGEIVIASKAPLTIEEMKNIVKYLWTSVIEKATGCYNGFYYKDLRPESFSVSIAEEEPLETAKQVEAISDNILACFSIQDMNRVMACYDKRSQYIENNIKTIADCL